MGPLCCHTDAHVIDLINGRDLEDRNIGLQIFEVVLPLKDSTECTFHADFILFF